MIANQEQFESSQRQLRDYRDELDAELEASLSEWRLLREQKDEGEFEASCKYSRLLMNYANKVARRAHSLGI